MIMIMSTKTIDSGAAMTKAALLSCEDYRPSFLDQVIRKSLRLIDTHPSIFKNKKVGVKPNLLMPSTPDQAIVTHPLFFKSVVKLILESGGMPILIESPAFQPLMKTMEKTGYADIVREMEIDVAHAKDIDILRYAGGRTYKRFEILKAFFDVDMIVNLPKLKSHGFTYLSAGVKNLFGAIPGLKKSQMHMKAQSHEEFSEYLLDLYGAFLYGFSPTKPMITIMDAILALEGEGPGTGGAPKRMNAVITSKDALAADYVAAMITAMDLEKAITVSRGFLRNYITRSPDEIEIVGNTIAELRKNDFKSSRGNLGVGISFWPLTTKTFKNLIVERPEPVKEKCILCYQCMTICPAKAISKTKKIQTPFFNYDACIRCFCCMEICPEAAIVIKKGKLQWLVSFR